MLARKIIDRYISAEVLRPFLMLIIGVIVIMLSVRLSTDMQLIIVGKVPAPIVMRMILYKLPEFIVLGLPIAFMIATLLGLARMSKDFEIIAIRATGTGSKRIMRPILLISVLVSIGSFFLNEEVVPEANRRSQVATDQAELQTKGSAQPVAKLAFKGVDSRFYFLESVNKVDKSMTRVLIFDSDPEHPYRMISAQRGKWSGTKWFLNDGVVQEYNGDVDAFVEQEYTFSELTVETNIKLENYLSGQVNAKQMASAELKELIRATRAGGQETRAYEIEYQAKYARPFATFFAALIAAPIGLKFARGGYIGFAISIILTFFYFVAQTIGEGFGNLGLLPITLAAWLPNIVFGVCGVIFYIQVK
ncbi:MAG TPA: LptF/LptG family permease [Candidatus Obscuribacterales bacterium]